MIELLQPYATLVAMGAKQYHSGRFGMNYLGPVGIYSSTYWNTSQDSLCRLPSIRLLLKSIGIDRKSKMTFGSIVAVANLDSCDLLNDVDQYRHINQIKEEVTDFKRGEWAYCFSSVCPVSFAPKTTGRYQWKLDAEDSLSLLGLCDEFFPFWGNRH